ncbi:neprilysin-1-like [Trichogramma pretiosum]|uniref:neprilysin-1-like n=1 Tax=Trichogramma pretiosum TaxID=7493 RepID=UPI0006C96F6B|nr:neprilysin-1-like [Trichogramma pretiosum]
MSNVTSVVVDRPTTAAAAVVAATRDRYVNNNNNDNNNSPEDEDDDEDDEDDDEDRSATAAAAAEAAAGDDASYRNGDSQSALAVNVNDSASKRKLVDVKSKKSFFKKHRRKLSLLFIAFLIGALTIACLTLGAMYAKFSKPMDLCDNEECMRIASSLKETMDPSVNPCDDFYKYVCGRWPEVHPSLDLSQEHSWFKERSVRLSRRILDLMVQNFTELKSDVPWPVHEAQLLFASCLDVQAQYKLGLEPLFDLLAELKLPRVPAAIKPRQKSDGDDDDNDDFVKQMARVKKMLWSDAFFGLQVYADPRDNRQKLLAFDLPDRDTPFPSDKILEKRLRQVRERARRHFLISDDDEQQVDQGEKAEDDKTRARGKSGNEAFSASEKLYMAEVLKQIISNGTSESATCKTRHEFDIVPEAEITDLVDRVFNLSGVFYKLYTKYTNSSSSSSDFSEEPEEVDDEDYMLLDELQRKTDEYVRSVNESIVPRPLWRPFVEELLQGLEIDFDPAQQKVYVGDLEFLQEIALVLSSTDEQILETAVWWLVVDYCVPHTSEELRKIWNLYVNDVTGLGQDHRGWSVYCTDTVNELMGMAVAWLVVEPAFARDGSRDRVAEMLDNIKRAFIDFVVEDIEWMDGPTKVATLEKNRRMKSLIGFPDWLFEDGRLDEYYDGINITEDAYFNNMLQIIRVRNINGLMDLAENGTDDDDDDDEAGWPLDPTDVNAVHTFQENQIAIPSGILQFPFYGLGLEALNYGAIGSILGHELTHGFDNSGRRFDSSGNLKQWWSNETIARYTDRAACFVEQYDKYYLPEVDEYIDGELTLGENIADNGGLREAYKAYQLWKSKHGDEPLLPGFSNFTHEQLLFMSYAHMWCESYTSYALLWMLQDSHCPGHVRLQQALRNSEHFSRAFSCPVGSSMNPKKKCQLW